MFKYSLAGNDGSGFGSWNRFRRFRFRVRFLRKQFRRFRFPVRFLGHTDISVPYHVSMCCSSHKSCLAHGECQGMIGRNQSMLVSRKKEQDAKSRLTNDLILMSLVSS